MGVGADAEALDRLSELFSSDQILASQFFAMRRSVSADHRPYRKLIFAVLMDALDSFLCDGAYRAHSLSRRGRERREAADWIFDEAAAGAFSFNWLCDGLDLDASYLRAGIRRVEAKLTASNGL